eukprot:TRINITY_DN4315_c0_g1_i5.p1 TRINITY_DN4315_c0_g1~~TRINITY_DN4315_c0_g1_i5.p1  ORF type:complete len:388 (-),score=108.48 TRINITY_DN4315_c0_g1_i5:77-1240(-)
MNSGIRRNSDVDPNSLKIKLKMPEPDPNTNAKTRSSKKNNGSRRSSKKSRKKSVSSSRKKTSGRKNSTTNGNRRRRATTTATPIPEEPVSRGRTKGGNRKRSSSNVKASRPKSTRRASNRKKRTRQIGSLPAAEEEIPLRHYANTMTFWKEMEKYFCNITEEDIEFCSPDNYTNIKDSPLLDIPELGKHYSLIWEDEGYSLERNSRRTRSGNTTYVPHAQEPIACLDITARLLSALVEDGAPSVKDSRRGKRNRSSKAPIITSDPKTLAKIEQNLRNQLKSFQLINDSMSFNIPEKRAEESDQLCVELKNLQEELVKIVNINNSRKESYHHKLVLCREEQLKTREKTEELLAKEKELAQLYQNISKKRKRKKSVKSEPEPPKKKAKI